MKTIKNLFTKFIKPLLALSVAIFGLNTASAQDSILSATYTAGTPTNLLSGGKYLVKDILFISSSNATTSVKFYDSAGSTNIVRAAYTNFTSYATNYNVVWTNSSGILVTNTQTGVYRQSVPVSASTNEAPALAGPFLITALGTRTISDVNVIPVNGFTLMSAGAGIVEIVYEKLSP